MNQSFFSRLIIIKEFNPLFHKLSARIFGLILLDYSSRLHFEDDQQVDSLPEDDREWSFQQVYRKVEHNFIIGMWKFYIIKEPDGKTYTTPSVLSLISTESFIN